jgi:hypothetical protein
MAFRRALGPFDATMVVVGGIIGSGIFVLPSVVAQRLPTSGLVLAAWLVGGAIALAGAFAFAELATLYPRAGGEYVYLREAYHPLVAFLFGWASLVMIQGADSPRSRSPSRSTPCASSAASPRTPAPGERSPSSSSRRSTTSGSSRGAGCSTFW